MVSSELLTQARDIFIDSVNVDLFIQLASQTAILKDIEKNFHHNFKLILIFGEPGTGKSMMIQRMFQEYSHQYKMALYATPLFNEKDFFRYLMQDILDMEPFEHAEFSQFVELIEYIKLSQPPIVILDEAQMYDITFLEKVRLISDTQKIKFILTFHTTDQNALLLQEHFKDRVSKQYELQNATFEELNIYIQKKFEQKELLDIAQLFTKRNLKLIHLLTKGNFRKTNKLLHTLFDLILAYQQSNRKLPAEIISTKLIEMAAIHTGLIHV